MPATAVRPEARAGRHGSDLLPRAGHLPGGRAAHLLPGAASADRAMSPTLSPAGAAAMMVAHANGEGAAEARRAILGQIQEVYGNRKSTRLNSSHIPLSRMPSSA